MEISAIAALTVVFLHGALMLWAGAVALMAWHILHPPRLTDGKALATLRRVSPADIGLTYEALTFRVRNESDNKSIELAAWWIPGGTPSDRCAILIHDYADAKVGSIAWAPLFHELGFHVLAVDLRAHGESAGRRFAGGAVEGADLAQVIDQIKSLNLRATGTIILFAAGIGAVAAFSCAAHRPQDIRAIIADSPPSDVTSAMHRYMDSLGFPGVSCQRPALWLARRIMGTRFTGRSISELRERADCPTFFILPEHPYWQSERQRDGLLAQAGERAWLVPQATHLHAFAAYSAEYRQRIGNFLQGVNSATLNAAGAV